MGDLRENGVKARRLDVHPRSGLAIEVRPCVVHSETILLFQTGLIARTAENEVGIGWVRIVTELNLAA